MIVAFFESIKYVGHLIPLAVLRVFMGYYFFQSGMARVEGGFLDEPQLAGQINEWLVHLQGPYWYGQVLEYFAGGMFWKVGAYTVTYIEFLVGLSFIVGFLVRPLSIIGAILCFNFFFLGQGDFKTLNLLLVAIFVLMGWSGAGRCLGLDYFFFKRQRGIWW